MRILHAIEREQQRCLHRLQCREELILAPGRKRCDLGGDSLVGDIAELVPERAHVGALYLAPVTPGELQQLTGSRIVTLLREAHIEHALGVPREHHSHRMHTVDGLGAFHGAARLAVRGQAQPSSASARSMSPSIGFTAVTTTRRCEPVRSRRPLRRPRQAWPSSSIT